MRDWMEQLEGRVLTSATGHDPQVTVMTQNLYIGTDLDPVVSAIGSGDRKMVISALSNAWASVVQNDFPARAVALAKEIDAARPAVIGLQEADTFFTGPPDSLHGGTKPASTVRYDFVQSLLDALHARGLNYAVAVSLTNANVELAAHTKPGVFQDIRVADHDVILFNQDLGPKHFKLSNPQHHTFVHKLNFSFGFGLSFSLKRGWASVDATVNKQSFRFVTTHLEEQSEAIRAAQMKELVIKAGRTNLPLVFAADFNADAHTSDAVYTALLDSGLVDAWTQTHGSEPGLTCCEAPDLRNDTSVGQFDVRIDLVLLRGNVTARSVDVVGEEPADRTKSLLWPSDHAGVVATIRL